jgi:hypothetical protein
LLNARDEKLAAEFLKTVPFELYDGHNSFADEFNVLAAYVSPGDYVRIERQTLEPQVRLAFMQISHAVMDAGQYIRFIALYVATDRVTGLVAQPELSDVAESVRQALADAELLLRVHGASNAADRIHTAFHGYLRGLAAEAQVVVRDKANAAEIFGRLRAEHPAFSGLGTERTVKILRNLAAIVDTLDPVRDKETLVHPNEVLLSGPDAMLYINSIRTILHWLEAHRAG